MVIAKLHITIITVHPEGEHKAKILSGSQEQVPDKSWSSTLTFDCTKEFLWFFKSSTFTTGCDPKPRNREGPLGYWHTCSPRKASSGLSRSSSSPGLLYHPGISATFPTHLVMLHMWVKPKRNWIQGRSDRALTGFSTAGMQNLREELLQAKSLSLMRKKEHSWYGLRPNGIFELSSPWLTPAIPVFSVIPESEKIQHAKDQMLLYFCFHTKIL